MVLSKQKRKIGIIGLSFKAGTDDLRYSPTVALVEQLLGKGCQLKIYDENVYLSKLVGANKQYIEEHIPHLSELITNDIEGVVKESEVIVISHAYDKLPDLLNQYTDKSVIDLVNIAKYITNCDYEGICW